MIGSPIDETGDNKQVNLNFIPYRGPFARGIFVTAVVETERSLDEITKGYQDFYKGAAFTHVMTDHDLDLLKGAVGQAVQNMNIMFGIDETAGLRLKPSAF